MAESANSEWLTRKILIDKALPSAGLALREGREYETTELLQRVRQSKDAPAQRAKTKQRPARVRV